MNIRASVMSADPRRRLLNAARGRYTTDHGADARAARRNRLAHALGASSLSKRDYQRVTRAIARHAA